MAHARGRINRQINAGKGVGTTHGGGSTLEEKESREQGMTEEELIPKGSMIPEERPTEVGDTAQLSDEAEDRNYVEEIELPSDVLKSLPIDMR
jgi:hypothetical protein